MTTLLDLPDELLLEIASLVTIQGYYALEPAKPGAWLIRDAIALSSTCKRVRRISLPHSTEHLVICADEFDEQAVNLRGLSLDLSLVRYVLRLFAPRFDL